MFSKTSPWSHLSQYLPFLPLGRICTHALITCRLYDSKSEAEGKAAAKAELRKHMSLSSADVPLVGVVTRLTHQKGIHLIKHAAWRTLERGGQFVLLGSAPDPRVQVLTPIPALSSSRFSAGSVFPFKQLQSLPESSHSISSRTGQPNQKLRIAYPPSLRESACLPSTAPTLVQLAKRCPSRLGPDCFCSSGASAACVKTV